MADTLLTYAVSTAPSPLQASPAAGDPVTAELTVVISNNTRKVVECASISFTILVGENAKDLTAGAAGITSTSQTEGWSLQQSGSGGVFTAQPKTPAAGKIGQGGLAFTLSGVKINRQPGTSLLTVTEIASQPQAAPPAPQQARTTTLPLAKFPPHFTVSDLTADPLVVVEGGSTTLSWSGSRGANYTLRYGDNVITQTRDTPPQPLPAAGSYTVEGLEDNPTIFYLVVTLPVPGQDKPLVFQRNCPVTVEAVTIKGFDARPSVVGINGVTRLSWRTKNVTSCTLDPGNHPLPPNGHLYVVVPQTQTFTLTAFGSRPDPTPPQEQRTVTVDPTIVHTGGDPSYILAGAPGQVGLDGPPGGDYGTNGGDGGDGRDAPGGFINLHTPLDTSSRPAHVFLIGTTGGGGGRGGNGGDGNRQGGRGGDGGKGGNASDLSVVLGPPGGGPPAQFVVVNVGGKGGAGGKAGRGGNPPSPDGSDGHNGKSGRVILRDEDPDSVAAELDAYFASGAADAGQASEAEDPEPSSGGGAEQS